MGAALWGGLQSASRYTIACPRCGDVTARTDCDSLGRTIVMCRCQPTGFAMPLTIGGSGAPWPIDVSAEKATPGEFKRRGIRARKPGVRRCCWEEFQPDESCDVGVNGRSKLCFRHGSMAMRIPFPCPTPGCSHSRSHRAKTCSDCARQLRINRRQADRDRRKAQLSLELGR